MKKFILLAGLAAMLSVSPALAAMKPMVHKHVAMCLVHGKKVVCHHKHKHHVKHSTVKHVVKKKKY